MRTGPLVPDPTVVALAAIVTEADGIALVVRATRAAVCCPCPGSYIRGVPRWR